MKALNAIMVVGLISVEVLLASTGKISGVTYFDYFVEADQYSEFEIHRSYFTYTTEVSETVHFKFQLDVGRPKNNEANQQLVAYLKNAKVDWNSSFGKLTFGLQGMNVFNVQEKTWGYRFIEKSSMDLNKWASSADLGIGYTKSFGLLHTSLLMTNGSGYKQAETDKYKKFSGQAVFGEKKLYKNVGFNIGSVFVYEQTDVDPNTVLGVFGGYADNQIRFGAEWERLKNDNGTEQIISLYGNYHVKEKMDLFTRFDRTDKEQYLIAGVNYQPEKGLIIAPNIRYSELGSSDSKTEYGVNFQFKF